MEVGEARSLTGESVEKGDRDEQASVPSLAPPQQAASQRSKEGHPAQVNTEGPAPLQPISWAKTKKYGPN